MGNHVLFLMCCTFAGFRDSFLEKRQRMYEHPDGPRGIVHLFQPSQRFHVLPISLKVEAQKKGECGAWCRLCETYKLGTCNLRMDDTSAIPQLPAHGRTLISRCHGRRHSRNCQSK